MDTHDPFMPRLEHVKAIGSSMPKKEIELARKSPEYTDILKEHDKWDKIIDLYDGEILAVDESIREIFSFFKERGLYDRTLFIITADHGEEFNDHDDYGHRAHLFDELIRVPLILAGGPIDREERSGWSPGHREKKLVSLVQLTPTILSLAKAETDHPFDAGAMLEDMDGNDEYHVMACTYHKGIVTRFNNMSDPSIKKMICVRDDRYKYVFDEETGEGQLFDLLADPLEKTNVAESHKQLSEKMHEKSMKYISERGYLVMKRETKPKIDVSNLTNVVGKLKMKI